LQVWNPCQKACEFYEDATAKNRCRNDCSSTLQNCNNECNNLFGVGEGEGASNEYEGYALDVENLQYKNEYRDIDSDRHRTFVCRIKPTTQVLDNTPITTRYFRVRARYNYLLENSVKVTIEQARAPISDYDYLPFEETGLVYQRPTQELYQGYPSNTDIDKYFASKNSELVGTGQCIKDIEAAARVPALVVLSVANLESTDFGKLSSLARLNYNLFGIKFLFFQI
jgi:hypothetical protein